MGDRQVAQAAELVRALSHQLHEMITKLARVERQGVTGMNARACAIRLEAASLRKDIQEAQVLIDRLRRRYPDAGEQTQQRPPGRRPRSQGIIAGVVFVVAVIFFSGFFVGSSSDGHYGWHRGYHGDCDGSCPMMGQGGMMGPGGMGPGGPMGPQQSPTTTAPTTPRP